MRKHDIQWRRVDDRVLNGRMRELERESEDRERDRDRERENSVCVKETMFVSDIALKDGQMCPSYTHMCMCVCVSKRESARVCSLF